MTLKALSSLAGKQSDMKSVGLVLIFAFLLVCAPRGVHGFGSFDFNSKHNFTGTSVYKGGSVCGECHAAGGGAIGDGTRILVPFLDNSKLIPTPIEACDKTCHATPPNYPAPSLAYPLNTVPTGWVDLSGGWNDGVIPPPAKTPHDQTLCIGGKTLVCGVCHTYRGYANCLGCHNDATLNSNFCGGGIGGSDSDRDLGISKYIVGLDAPATILSSHRVASNDDCLKCHGAAAVNDHPGRAANSTKAMTPLLYLADGAKTAITQPTTSNVTAWNAFNRDKRQTLCLSCHDGLYDADPSSVNIKLGGQSVPPVPRYNYNSGAPNFAGGTPYFANVGEANFAAKNYFVNNGHGAPLSSRTGTAMGLTCMGETTRSGDVSNDTAPGCHSAHGTKNFSILRDSGTYRTPFNTVSAIDTPEKMSQFCQLCHDRASFDVGAMKNGFHAGLMNTGQLSHFDSRTSQSSDTFTNGNTVYWRANHVNMKTGDPAVNEIQPMPFFNSKTAANTLRDGRLHSNTPGPGNDKRKFDGVIGDGSSSSGSVITCVTCHDPHGTFDSQTERATDNTFGMLRFPEGIDGDSYTWALCGQCHIK